MKRVGIITIQKSEVNYGACLQSYALWYYVKEITGFCQVINLLRPCHSDYKISPSFGERYEYSFKHRIKEKLINQLSVFKQSKNDNSRIKKFHLFNNKIDYSRKYYSVEELYRLPPEYDIYLTGSDQVWNPKMPFINEPYFLTFAPKDSIKVSYASSFGIDSLSDDCKYSYTNWLKSYNYISVRENTGADIVEELIGVRPKVVLDPVFLLSKECWEKEMQPIIGIEEKKYILLYMLKYDEEVLNNAYAISQIKSLPLLLVLSEDRIVTTSLAKQLVNIGPAEWLWLVKNADTFVTTSFHGTAFSIILQTPLAVFIDKMVTTNSRIETLVTRFDLSNNLFNAGNFKIGNRNDFSIASSKLSSLLDEAYSESAKYIETFLND